MWRFAEFRQNGIYPNDIAGLVMGVWFLAASVGNYLGGAVASLYETFALPALFAAITAVALLATLFMAVSIKPLRRMLKRSLDQMVI